MTERPEGPSDSPGFQMWRVALAWQRAVAGALRPYDLTHAQFVLLAGAWWLGRQDGPPTQQELAVHTGMDPMMTSQVLRRMQAKGLLDRVADAVDARARRVHLTAAGKRTLRQALPVVERTDADFFSPVRRDHLMAVLGVLASGEAS